MSMFVAPDNSISIDLPQRHKMSYEAYLELAGDAQIVEWVNGEAIIYMLPQYKHQDILSFIGTLLKLFVKAFGNENFLLTAREAC